jgi:uncharacterized protein
MEKTISTNTLDVISFILVIVGALNWLLVGLGIFFSANLNLVNLLLGSIPTLEAIVYLLVGISAIYLVIKMLMK